MAASAPLVGVTGPSGGLPVSWWAIRLALKRVGATPIRLRPAGGFPGMDFAAFVLSGGNDINPTLYGSVDGQVVSNVDPQRDAFEMQVLHYADARAIPVLGICRGMQIMNVGRGGTLYSDIAHLRATGSTRSTLRPIRRVDIRPESRLARVVSSHRLRVNSLHHQAVKNLGQSLVCVARDDDGIVQAIESASGSWRLGVQWHPEYQQWQPAQVRLFAALVTQGRS